jgi:hypothetical protein
MDINISDEFGDITLEELSGALKVQLSQGIFTARKLLRGDIKPLNSVYINHGKLSIGELNWMTLNLLNCSSVNIEKAQAINMVSSISKISIGDIKSLVCNSKSDNYNIKSITNLYSESIYSGFTTEALYGQLNSKLTYGSISISNISKGFSSIEITSNQAQINLSPGSVLSFNTDITGNDAILIFPFNKYPGIIKTQTENTTTLIGLAGSETGTKSLIRIRATGGQITIQ